MATKAKAVKARTKSKKVKSTEAKPVKAKATKGKSLKVNATKAKPAKTKATKARPMKAKTVKSKASSLKPQRAKSARAKAAQPKKSGRRISQVRNPGRAMDSTTSLLVIGSGFGRTGTKSLKEALEQLGLGPCHHMHENVEHPELVPHWQAVAAGKPVDWSRVFAGYRSQVDWPGAHVWRELSVAFPQAKIVHTVRPEDVWWNSFSRTIGKLGATYKQMPLPPHIRDMLDAAYEMIEKQTFGDKMADREAALAAYNLRTSQVRDAIPSERLLVFDVAEGWEPLCRFLNVPVPDTPFPHRNLRADFWEVLGGEPN